MDEGQCQSNRKESLCAVRHLSIKPHKNREVGSNTSACNIFTADREKGLNEAKLIILLHSAQLVHQEGCHREARRETYLSGQMKILTDQAQGTRRTHRLLGACNRSRKICSPQYTPYTAVEDGQHEEVMF